MSEEQKNSINITVNGDAQIQIDKYTKSFEELRNSLNNLSQPFNIINGTINNLDKNLSKYSESITKLNNQNKELSSSSEKADNNISDLSSSFTTWAGVIDIIIKATKTWTVALTGGLAIVTTFLPEIINFVKALFTGKDALNAMVLNFKNLNDVMRDSNKEASSEITRLRILYRSATDVNNSYGDRIKSVQELKKEFPAHLKNLSDEDILNGKAKKKYDELSKAIFENAKAKAYLIKSLFGFLNSHLYIYQ